MFSTHRGDADVILKYKYKDILYTFNTPKALGILDGLSIFSVFVLGACLNNVHEINKEVISE